MSPCWEHSNWSRSRGLWSRTRGDRLRRADQLAVGARCRTALRDHRPAASHGDCAIVYISHFLEEVRRIAETYTVLGMAGRWPGPRSAETELSTIIGAHGRPRPRRTLPARAARDRRADPGARDLRAKGRNGGDLGLRRGEILGVAGLVGTAEPAGADDLRPRRRSSRERSDRAGRRRPCDPRRRIAQGVGFLSEDRKGEGLAGALDRGQPDLPGPAIGTRRMGLAEAEGTSRGGRRVDDPLRIAATGPLQSAGSLSGGNQQKVALARLLHHRPTCSSSTSRRGDRRGREGRDLPTDRRARRAGEGDRVVS